MEQKISIEIKNLVDKWKSKEGNLIMILHEIQNHHGYVPRELSLELSQMLDVPLARIYEVITFYNFFKLTPPGKHKIAVCMGTACYLKGGQDLINEVKNILHIEPGQTTKDGQYYLDMVRCLGCCGLAPVMMIDEKVYGKVKKSEIMDILSKHGSTD
ncbi:MAG TPA: NADH-quinone oxidoreductase subunit NuoE [Candidatus Omnitrophota bacterium]|nr:NADH-quinone oxidoreductase subunit NuoE [Candidatus Omnitrophota bacterium]